MVNSADHQIPTGFYRRFDASSKFREPHEGTICHIQYVPSRLLHHLFDWQDEKDMDKT